MIGISTGIVANYPNKIFSFHGVLGLTWAKQYECTLACQMECIQISFLIYSRSIHYRVLLP